MGFILIFKFEGLGSLDRFIVAGNDSWCMKLCSGKTPNVLMMGLQSKQMIFFHAYILGFIFKFRGWEVLIAMLLLAMTPSAKNWCLSIIPNVLMMRLQNEKWVPSMLIFWVSYSDLRAGRFWSLHRIGMTFLQQLCRPQPTPPIEYECLESQSIGDMSWFSWVTSLWGCNRVFFYHIHYLFMPKCYGLYPTHPLLDPTPHPLHPTHPPIQVRSYTPRNWMISCCFG